MSDIETFDPDTQTPNTDQINELKQFLGLPTDPHHPVGVGVECPRCSSPTIASWPFEHCWKCGNRDWIDGRSPSFFRAPEALDGVIETSSRELDERPYTEWHKYELTKEIERRNDEGANIPVGSRDSREALATRLQEHDESLRGL